jgi:hypothetical protein
MRICAAYLVLALLAGCTSVVNDRTPVAPPKYNKELGLELVQRALGLDCPFTLRRTAFLGIGTNGAWSEIWYTDTCRGDVVFELSYRPPEFFPNRASPYEVKELRQTTKD